MIFGTEKPVTKTLEWIPVMFSVSYVNHHMGLTAKPVLCTSQAVLHSDSVCLYHYQATKLKLLAESPAQVYGSNNVNLEIKTQNKTKHAQHCNWLVT